MLWRIDDRMRVLPADALKAQLYHANPGTGDVQKASCSAMRVLPQLSRIHAEMLAAPAANTNGMHALQVISNATFKLGIRGFTSLLQAVSKGRSPRAWEKALEIKAVMEQRPDLRPNLFTYSVCH